MKAKIIADIAVVATFIGLWYLLLKHAPFLSDDKVSTIQLLAGITIICLMTIALVGIMFNIISWINK